MSNLNLRILEFYKQEAPVRDAEGKETGELTLEDWVAWCHPGAADRTVIRDAVRRVARVVEPQPDASPSMRSPYDLWKFIEPHYETWKKGEEMPLEGTPLAAWTGCRREHVEIFKRHSIRTVEEVAELNDAMMVRLAVPGIRELKMQATRFLAAADQNKVSVQMRQKDEEVASLRNDLADMKAQMSTLMNLTSERRNVPRARSEDSVAARISEERQLKRPPGRPPKAKAPLIEQLVEKELIP